jgi:sulfite exporter TauE/SafE
MELWTAFILGLVGSFHCAGMCGPLALALPPTGNTNRSYLVGRLAYNLGRISTYGALGGICGLIGQSLMVAGLQRWVSLLVGAAILTVFAASAFPRFARKMPMPAAVGWLKKQFAQLLHRRTFRGLLLLGSLNGLLPCGLVYAACAAAITSGGLRAIEYMFVFGLGTVPMMLGLTLAGKKLHFALRRRLQKLIPVCVVLLGLLLIVRGLALGIPYLSPDPAYPSCCIK